MIAIYDKNSLIIRGVVEEQKNVFEEMRLNVLPNFGGTDSDYDTIEIHKSIKYITLEKSNGIVTIIDESILEKVKPSNEEIEKAERQINLINDLTELGVV